MRATYYKYNNSVELDLHNNDDDIEIIHLIEDAMMARAKADLDEDDAEACIKALEGLMNLEECLVKMTNWKEETDESGDSDGQADA